MLSQQQRSFLPKEIVNIEATAEVVSRPSPVHPDDLLLIRGKAMVLPDWTKLDKDDQDAIIDLLARELRLSEEDGELDEVVIDLDEQPTIAKEAVLILPEKMETVMNSSRHWKTTFEFLAVLDIIVSQNNKFDDNER